MCGWSDTVWTLLLPAGHRLSRRGERCLWVPRPHDAVRVGVLQDGHSVRRPLNVNLRNSCRGLHRGPDLVRKDVLPFRSAVSAVRGLREYNLWPPCLDRMFLRRSFLLRDRA